MPSQPIVDVLLPPTREVWEQLRKDLREDIKQEFGKLSTRLADEIRALICQDALHPSMISLKIEESTPYPQQSRQGCNPICQDLGMTVSHNLTPKPTSSSMQLDVEAHTLRPSNSLRHFISEDITKQEQSLQNWLHRLTIEIRNKVTRSESEMSDARSCLASCVHHRVFTVISFSVLLANSIWMGYDSDQLLQKLYDPEHSHSHATYSLSKVSLTFSTFYVFELVLKLIALHRYFFIGVDWKWNLLDLLLVILSIPEYVEAIGNFNIFRLIRLVKMTRALRLMRLIRFLTSLREILLSFVDTLGCLFWSFIAMALVVYICAILFMQTLSFGIEHDVPPSDEIKEKFKSTASSMLTLFSVIAGGEDWYYLVEGFNQNSWSGLCSQYAFVLYIYFMMFGFLSVIIGVFCSKVQEASCRDEDLMVAKQEVKYMRIVQQVMDVFHSMGLRCDERITRECFSAYVKSSKSLALRGMPGFHGFQFFSLDKLWHILTLSSASADGDHDGTVDLAGFVLAILRFSGEVSATDLVLLSSDIERLDRRLERDIRALERDIRHMDELTNKIDAQAKGEVPSPHKHLIQL